MRRSAFVRPLICDPASCFQVGIETSGDLFIARPTKVVPVVPTGSPSHFLSFRGRVAKAPFTQIRVTNGHTEARCIIG